MIIFARVFDYSEIGLTPYFSLSARPFVIVVADAVTNVSSRTEKFDADVRYYWLTYSKAVQYAAQNKTWRHVNDIQLQ